MTVLNVYAVFQALGVSRLEDMELLKQTMEPYIVCVTCQPLLEAVHPLSPPAVSPPLVKHFWKGILDLEAYAKY